MSHIAMMSSPVFSHVVPTLGLARELVVRGHRVTYVGIPSFAERISATGARFAGYTSTLPVANGLPPQSKGALDSLEMSVTEDMSLLPQLRRIFAGDPPDFILNERGTDAIRVLAHELGVPTMQFCTTVVPWEGQHEHFMREAAAVLDEMRGVQVYQRFIAWLANNGMADVDPAEFLLAEPDRALVLIPQWMQPLPEAVNSDRYTFVGWCGDGQSERTGWRRPEGVARLAFASVGSVLTERPDFYRECLAAFRDLPDWHVVLAIGPHLDPAVLGDVPANVEVHRWVPQAEVVEVSDVFITHGGMGSCMDGLIGGTPMVVVPHANDQFSNAERLAELGVAELLDSTRVTAQQLRTMVGRVTADPRVVAELATIRRQLGAQYGPGRAADLVEMGLP